MSLIKLQMFDDVRFMFGAVSEILIPIFVKRKQ